MLDARTSSEVDTSISRIDKILDSGIFSAEGAGHPLYFSALTEMLICLNDLLGKSQAAGFPIDFEDHVSKRGAVTGVRTLVLFVRNAVCHISSPNHNHEEINARLSFNSCIGKGCLAEIDGLRLECEFDDDIAFFFGAQRLYLKRHAIRAFESARASLTPLLISNQGRAT
jgi:hypothetical protein